jgi:hypothetical protein
LRADLPLQKGNKGFGKMPDDMQLLLANVENKRQSLCAVHLYERRETADLKKEFSAFELPRRCFHAEY